MYYVILKTLSTGRKTAWYPIRLYKSIKKKLSLKYELSIIKLFLTLPTLQVPVHTDECKHFPGLEQKPGGSPIPLRLITRSGAFHDSAKDSLVETVSKLTALK